MLYRILKIYLLFLSQNIKKEVMYRTNFFTLFAIDFVGLGLVLVFFRVIFRENSLIAGWNFESVLLLIGSVAVLREAAYLTFRSGLQSLSQEIRTGRLDLTLAKPFSPQLLIAFKGISLTESLSEGIMGLILIIYGIMKFDGNIGAYSILFYTLLGLISYILFYSVALFFSSLSFWLIKANNLGAVVWNFMEMARYPRDILRGFGKIIFTFIIPTSLIVTVPVSVLIGKTHFDLIFDLILVTVVFFIISNIVWRRGIRHYESASS